jgi:ankyrin repeat protein
MKFREKLGCSVMTGGAVLLLALPVFLTAQAASNKPAAKPQIVDMGTYTVAPPEGKWKVEVIENGARVVFSRHKGGGILNVLGPGAQERETYVLAGAIVLSPQDWNKSEAALGDELIGEYAGSFGDSARHKVEEKGDTERNGKKLRFAKVSAVAREPSVTMDEDRLFLLYFPADFKRAHRIFQFESIFARSGSMVKLYQNPGAEPAFAVIDSLEIKDPLKAAAGPDGELLRAAVAGDLEAVRRAIDQGAKADAAAPQLTALGAAALWGQREIVDLLLEKGADVNRTDMEGGRTPLHQALIGGEGEIAERLLQAGAGADPRTLAGFSPLMYASIFNLSGLASKLIEQGADVNARTNDGETALIFAAQCGSLEAAQLLAAAGADLNAQKNNGWTALMSALDDEHGDVARRLMELGADVGLMSEKGWSALMEVIEAGDEEMVRALVEKGADVNSKTPESGWTPLLHALSLEGRDGISLALIEAGADVKAKLAGGTTSLMLAASNASADIVRLLLEKGVDVTARNEDKRTALKNASSRKRANIVQILKAAGAKG